MTAISLHLLLWVGILKVWPCFCDETRPFYAERFAPDQWLQRSPGRLSLARMAGLWRKILRLEKGLSMYFQAVLDPKPGSWQQVKEVISISRVQISRYELDSRAFYSPETVPKQQISKIEPNTYASAH